VLSTQVVGASEGLPEGDCDTDGAWERVMVGDPEGFLEGACVGDSE